MPEQHRKPRSRYAPQLTLSRAAEHGMLVKLHCTLCRRTTYYLASDLLDLYGDQPLFDVRFPCSRDETAEFVKGDYGHLRVRRPAGQVTIQKWKSVRLGD